MQAVAEPVSHIWNNPVFACQSNDWRAFHARLIRVCGQRAFEMHRLGLTQQMPIYLLTRQSENTAAKNLLIASGFHGEEPAGPWGLLHALETLDSKLLDLVNLAILPLVNVSGFCVGQRLNHRLENPNRGFLPSLDGVSASQEGRVLMHHEFMLADLGCDGVLSCHEDLSQSSTYIYANEPFDKPSSLALKLRDSHAHYFPLHADGLVDGCKLVDGIVYNHPDSSFEGWLFQRGVAASYCTETPGLACFEPRVLANAAMVKTYIEYHVR